jgi:HAD superfamily hydrolase (TIGR01509 family)
LGLVTSSGRREVEPVIVRTGLAPLFGAAVYGEDVKRHKPDPEPYRTAAERLGARRALVVEDSQAGIASGRAAGFEVLEIPHADRTAEMVRTLLGRSGVRGGGSVPAQE